MLLHCGGLSKIGGPRPKMKKVSGTTFCYYSLAANQFALGHERSIENSLVITNQGIKGAVSSCFVPLLSPDEPATSWAFCPQIREAPRELRARHLLCYLLCYPPD